jgi:TonB family protein
MKNVFMGASLLFFMVFICCHPRKSENELKNKITDSITSEGMILDYPLPDFVDSLQIFSDPKEASYPGGYDSLKSFIKTNLISPRQTVDFEGTVFIQFIVNEDGAPTEFNILKGLSPECDRNAIDLLKKMPKWIPGKVNGIPVKQKFVLPVKFSL